MYGLQCAFTNTSPIIPVIDFMEDSPIYKLNHLKILNHSKIKYNLTLKNERISTENINYFRSIFKWEYFIKQINYVINEFS